METMEKVNNKDLNVKSPVEVYPFNELPLNKITYDEALWGNTPELNLIKNVAVPSKEVGVYIKCVEAANKYWDRYLKNTVKLITPSDDKELYKVLLKNHASLLDLMGDEHLAILNTICENTKITRIIDFLKYGTYSNYREKLKVIKGFDFTDFELIKLLTDYSTINKTLYLNKYSLTLKYSNAPAILTEVLCLINSTILLIRCVRDSYHKHEILSYRGGKAIKKRVPIKNLIDVSCSNTPMFGRSNFVKNNLIYYMLVLLKNGRIIDYPLEHIESLSVDELNWLFEAIFNYIPQEYDLNHELSKIILDTEYESLVSFSHEPVDACGSFLINAGMFFNRKVLLPRSGVVILPEGDPLVESICLKEKQIDDCNFLIVVVRYTDGIEKVNSIALDIDNPSLVRLHLKSDDVKDILERGDGSCIPHSFLYVFDFFGIKEFQSTLLGQQLDKNGISGKYSVISPRYWAYRSKNYSTNKDTVNKFGLVIKREFEVDIAPFIRRIQGEASQEAKDYAKRVGLILEGGYTVVKSHKRSYNKVI